MNYTQEQIDRANQVDLVQFLHSQGETLIKSGNEYRWKRHDSLTVKGNKWFRHSQSKGGYPIDFVMEFFSKTFPEAVFLLIGEAPADNSTTAAPSEKFRLPPRNRYIERAMVYLRQRKIPEELIQEFYREGLIYEERMNPGFLDMPIAKERKIHFGWMCLVLIKHTILFTGVMERACLYLRHR